MMSMPRRRYAGALLALICVTSPAAAQTEFPVVPLFMETCASGDLTADAREAAVAANPEWISVDGADVRVREFQRVPSIEPVFGLEKPTSVKQWRRTWNGKDTRAVIVRYADKNRYRALCAVIIPDVDNAMPYIGDFRRALKPLGLNGKSTDLPHYQEYSGRLQNGRRSRADIYSRSTAVVGGKNMHLYIAY
jgi:hypothetical protein